MGLLGCLRRLKKICIGRFGAQLCNLTSVGAFLSMLPINVDRD